MGKHADKENKVEITVSYDGFQIILNGNSYWIDQGSDPSEFLAKIFEELGCKVKIVQDF